MKALIKSLIVLALLLALVTGAGAAWNVRQNADGTADYVRSFGTEEITEPIGSHFLNVRIDNLTIEQSVAVAIPVTGVQVSYIIGALAAAITTADEEIQITLLRKYHIAGETTFATIGEMTSATSPMIFAGTLTGGMDIGENATFIPQTGTPGNILHQGDTLIFHNNAATTQVSTGASPAVVFTITLEPRQAY